MDDADKCCHGNGPVEDVRHWNPLGVLAQDTEDKIALIHLNTPLPSHPERFKKLWAAASFKAVVDGASNELYDCSELSHSHYLPDVITGDFDSARPEVLEHYKQQGCTVVSTPDQDFTDFTKCLKYVTQHIKETQLQVSSLMVYVTSGGRFDHALGNINTLFTARSLTELPVYLISPESLTWLLPPGRHEINVDSQYRGDCCGLIPIGCPCDHVTTTGLVWNLKDHSMEFGKLISTSNAFQGTPTVTVQNDQPLVWTMGLQ